MGPYSFLTVDVFTDRRFGGNPLAVFPDASGLSDRDMQALAAEFNLSETTFVLPPDDPDHTARVRIFTPASEMPFAGHPNVGTGFVLAQRGRDRDGMMRFEELAGLVEVRVNRAANGDPTGAVIDAPQPLTLGPGPSAGDVAACAGLRASDVRLEAHAPVLAGVGIPFVVAEVTAEALAQAAPDAAQFRRVLAQTPGFHGRFNLHLYAHGEEGPIRTRMFAPLEGIHEDPATGSANAALAALLLSLTPEGEATYEMVQGVEMGRPSALRASARRGTGGIRASIGGGCVPVLRGEAFV